MFLVVNIPKIITKTKITRSQLRELAKIKSILKDFASRKRGLGAKRRRIDSSLRSE